MDMKKEEEDEKDLGLVKVPVDQNWKEEPQVTEQPQQPKENSRLNNLKKANEVRRAQRLAREAEREKRLEDMMGRLLENKLSTLNQKRKRKEPSPVVVVSSDSDYDTQSSPLTSPVQHRRQPAPDKAELYYHMIFGPSY